MSGQDVCEILKQSQLIAVVGISSNPNRTSRNIAEYLRNNGFRLVGVNPNTNFKDANGIKVFNSLSEIDEPIDIVNVFRKSNDIPLLIDDVLKVKPKVLWLQLGIKNNEAVAPVIKEGIETIQNMCIKVEHSYCF